MAGKICTGSSDNNGYHPRESVAYCEGMAYRASGASAAVPKTNNPHVDGSEAHTAWDAGWDFADAAAGGAIDSTTTCCNVSGTVAA